MEAGDPNNPFHTIEPGEPKSAKIRKVQCRAMLNGLLRGYKSPTNRELFHFTDPAEAPNVIPQAGENMQWDHLWEIQHVVNFLFQDENFFGGEKGEYYAGMEPLASWIILSVWLNDARNLFPVKAAFNQAKRGFKIEDYMRANPNRDVVAYFGARVASTDQPHASPVFTKSHQWAVDMALYCDTLDLHPYHHLVAFVGRKILDITEWGYPPITTLAGQPSAWVFRNNNPALDIEH